MHKLPEYPTGGQSDGYHTFAELYHHRTILFASLCNLCKEASWKSRQHNDPNDAMYNGMFIAGMTTPYGQATYHCENQYWDIFNVKELDRAPEFDGHTPEDALTRIYNYTSSK